MSEYIVDFGSLAMLSRVVESESNRLGEPVVRCKNCKHASAGEAVISGNWQHGNCHNPRYRGSLHVANVRADGFCAWGESE